MQSTGQRGRPAGTQTAAVHGLMEAHEELRRTEAALKQLVRDGHPGALAALRYQRAAIAQTVMANEAIEFSQPKQAA